MNKKRKSYSRNANAGRTAARLLLPRQAVLTIASPKAPIIVVNAKTFVLEDILNQS